MLLKLIERLKDTMHMVRFVKRNQNYTMMQFIQKSDGTRHNYAPDYPPSTYDDINNTICVFNIKRKAIPTWWVRFKYYWKFYKR